MAGASPSLRAPAVAPVFSRPPDAAVAAVRGRPLKQLRDDDWLAADVDPLLPATLGYAIVRLPADVADRVPRQIYAKPTGELVMWEKNRFGSTLCRHGNRKWYCGVDSCGGGPKYCKHAVAHALCAHASCREERPVGRCARAVASRATFSGGVVRGRGAKKHSPRTAPELRSGLRARQDFACPHNSNRSYCTVSGCGGTGLCQHGIHRSKCKDVRCMSRKKWLQHQMEIDEARDAAAVASSRECDQGAESEVTPCAVPAVTT